MRFNYAFNDKVDLCSVQPSAAPSFRTFVYLQNFHWATYSQFLL
jgi:hypothetical protein